MSDTFGKVKNIITTDICEKLGEEVVECALGGSLENSFMHCEVVDREKYSNPVKNWEKARNSVIDYFDEVNLRYEYAERYGGEGEGDEYWSVYKFTLNDEECFIQFDGWYASHYGSEYERMFEVEPVEKTVTVYNQVEGK